MDGSGRESDLRFLLIRRLHIAIKKPPTAMWRFFCPSGFAVRWVVLQPLPGIFIIPSCKQMAIPRSLYKFLILFEYLTFSADVNYDAASLSAISRSWERCIYSRKAARLPGLVSTDLSPVVNGGAVSSRDRIMKRYFCIAFIVASVLVVKSDEPNGFVVLSTIAQDK